MMQFEQRSTDELLSFTIWLFNIAMENHHAVDR